MKNTRNLFLALWALTVSVAHAAAQATPVPSPASYGKIDSHLVTEAHHVTLEPPQHAARRFFLRRADEAGKISIGFHKPDTGSPGPYAMLIDDAETVKTHLALGTNPSGADTRSAPNTGSTAIPAGELIASSAGLLGNGQTTVALTPLEAYGASYVPDSNVLCLPDGQWRYLPVDATTPVTVPAGDSDALLQINENHAWLATGTVPGRTPAERQAASRALLSIRLLTQANGAAAAGWGRRSFQYAWPRDSSFVAVAFAATGHSAEAYSILKYNAETLSAPSWPGQTRPPGTWNARTLLDGSRPPDSRPWQLDANGWVPWSIWEWYETAPRANRDQLLQALYPAIQSAANYTASSLDSQGLPPAEPDYAELPTATPNIGTAAPLLSGLHASADLARITGHPDDARAWAAAANRLAEAIAAHFAPLDYPRTVGGGLDSAVTFMAPPYNNAPKGLSAAIDKTYNTLVWPTGGVTPYQTHGRYTVYEAETGFFALAWSGMGQEAKANATMTWLLDHRNFLGEFPEQINPAGYSTTVTPLAWTDAVVLMTLTQLDGHRLPVPPA